MNHKKSRRSPKRPTIHKINRSSDNKTHRLKNKDLDGNLNQKQHLNQLIHSRMNHR
jgi:hypothetical protein